mmetsp:Transcript_12292/g.18442  ORF Transcript_12292/g.18442 Transcript_12292/m.18442 type:complete len:347 (+) Transcript_12292:19-1059(+)
MSFIEKLRIYPVLGTMTFSAQTDKVTAAAMLESFVKNEFKYIDTASMYCAGATETLIGEILNERPHLQSKLALQTKANPFTPEKGFTLSPESIQWQLSTSLQSLQSSSVDLYYLHAPDVNNSLEATLASIQEASSAGKFARLGLSNFATWEVVFIHYYMKERGWVVPSVYQGMYNGITRQVESDLLPALKRLKMSFYAYNPLAGGMLTGKYKRSVKDSLNDGRFNKDSFWGQKYRERYMQDVQFDAVELVQAACDQEGVAVANASLRWMIHHSKLSPQLGDGVIIGASNLDQFESNIIPFKNDDNERASEKGPLPSSVVEAYDRAWEIIRDAGVCPPYSRGVSKWD